MKIGIFGDSYGTRGQGARSRHSLETETSKAWSTYISEEFDTDNHCSSGSSFYYSANLFLKTHHLYDKIIFLITHPGRIEVVHPFAKNIIPNRMTTFEHATQLVKEYSTGKDTLNDKIYQASVDYFLYFHNFEQDSFYQYSAIDRLKNIRKDNVLFLPCFIDSVDEPDRNNNELFEISNLDTNNAEMMKKGDTRHCHFNDQNNIIFAKNIKNWILNGVWNFNINDYVSMNIDN